MELPSVAPLHREQRLPTSASEPARPPRRLSRAAKIFPKAPPERILIFDLETYATGFADPQWVPQVITCVAWKWMGDHYTAATASVDYAYPGAMPHLQPMAISKMIDPFLADLGRAELVVTYNGNRFDNPVLNGTMWLLKRKPIKPMLTCDLHQFGKMKGVKKGLDNVAVHLGAAEEKLAMNHGQWTKGYLEPGWPTIKARAKSDVELTEQVYLLKKELGWLKSPKMWRP